MLLGVLLWRREGRAGFGLGRWRWHILRGFGVGMATVAFFSALFGDRPDGIALAGAAVIFAGGLLLWWTGRVTEPSMTD